MTTYESPSALGRVIEGLRCQTRFPDEVLVADDGSGPETGSLLRSFQETAPFGLHHVRHQDQGFRAAKIRNEAVKRASGDYIVFLDGDCVPNRHFVSDHLQLREKGFFVQGKRVLVSEGAAGRFCHRHANSTVALVGMAMSGRLSNVHHVIRLPFFPALKNRRFEGTKSCNLGIHRSDVIAVNGFNEDFVGWGREDSEFVARLYKFGLARKIHVFRAVCFHLWHPESPRDNLARNDEMLRTSMSGSHYRCRNGIHKLEM